MGRRLLAPRPFLTSGAVLIAVAGGFALASALSGAASAGVLVQGTPSLVSYHRQANANSTISFTIGGNASDALYPGKTSPIDLAFTNTTNTTITLPATAIAITVTSPNPTCSASANFTVVHTLTSAITIPQHHTGDSLTLMGIPTKDWPVISMQTTNFNQDVCAGVTLTLHYSANVTSTQNPTGVTTGSGSGSGSGSQNGGGSSVPVQTATASSGGALAFTGFDVLLVGGTGVLLLLVGIGLLTWRRRLDALHRSSSAAGGDDHGD